MSNMDTILCSLSPKRLALLEEDPEVLSELLEARHETDIPGLLDLGPTWHALDILLGDGKDPVLADAIVGRSGKKVKGTGKARLLGPARVAEIAEVLQSLPKTIVADKYPQLAGKPVHGNYGQEVGAAGDNQWLRDQVEKTKKAQIAELSEALESVVYLYTQAATAKYSMICVIV